KRLTYVRLTMYTHFTFTLMAHCTSGAIRGSVSVLKDASTGNRTSNLHLLKLLKDFSTSCTTAASWQQGKSQVPHITSVSTHHFIHNVCAQHTSALQTAEHPDDN